MNAFLDNLVFIFSPSDLDKVSDMSACLMRNTYVTTGFTSHLQRVSESLSSFDFLIYYEYIVLGAGERKVHKRVYVASCQASQYGLTSSLVVMRLVRPGASRHGSISIGDFTS